MRYTCHFYVLLPHICLLVLLPLCITSICYKPGEKVDGCASTLTAAVATPAPSPLPPHLHPHCSYGHACTLTAATVVPASSLPLLLCHHGHGWAAPRPSPVPLHWHPQHNGDHTRPSLQWEPRQHPHCCHGHTSTLTVVATLTTATATPLPLLWPWHPHCHSVLASPLQLYPITPSLLHTSWCLTITVFYYVNWKGRDLLYAMVHAMLQHGALSQVPQECHQEYLVEYSPGVFVGKLRGVQQKPARIMEFGTISWTIFIPDPSSYSHNPLNPSTMYLFLCLKLNNRASIPFMFLVSLHFLLFIFIPLLLSN